MYRNTWNGGEGVATSTFLLSKMDFKQFFNNMKTPKFIVTSKWLQQSVFTVLYGNPVVTTKLLIHGIQKL